MLVEIPISLFLIQRYSEMRSICSSLSNYELMTKVAILSSYVLDGGISTVALIQVFWGRGGIHGSILLDVRSCILKLN